MKGVKKEYFFNDITYCPELCFPTINYKFKKEEINQEKNRESFLLFLIDITKYAKDLNFPQYVIKY
jgi:hypothetical protein